MDIYEGKREERSASEFWHETWPVRTASFLFFLFFLQQKLLICSLNKQSRRTKIETQPCTATSGVVRGHSWQVPNLSVGQAEVLAALCLCYWEADTGSVWLQPSLAALSSYLRRKLDLPLSTHQPTNPPSPIYCHRKFQLFVLAVSISAWCQSCTALTHSHSVTSCIDVTAIKNSHLRQNPHRNAA